MKNTSILLITLMVIIGCSGSPRSPQTPLRQHETLYKNPDPKIEALHVKAFNYDLGKGGVEQDRVKANALYLRAAKAGEPRSMMNYALNIFYGKGGKKDPEAAYYWIDRARFATQRTNDMKLKWRVRSFYDHVHKKLTPAQRKNAKSKTYL